MQAEPESPLASIIVLFLEGSPWIEQCLDSVRRNVPRSVSHEVIVLANGVAADAEIPVSGDDGMRILRSGANLGFGGGCNWASRHARGRYLVFLNDDTNIEPGWLEALIDSAEADRMVAAVGSLVLGPGNEIEEAGRVLWRDGASHGIASGLTQRKRSLPNVREVDYCSGCSLLVRRSAWEVVGGFDERYFPAYYEDVDLCLELHLRGWAVVCAAGSRVHHQRSVSTPALWRRFLGLHNHATFVEKWSDVLSCFDRRSRDRPSHTEIDNAADNAEERRRAVYHRFGMHGDAGTAEEGRATDRVTLLEQEVAHLQAELRLKDEYIAHIDATSPQMERGLRRVLADEQRRAERRERIRRIPLLGAAAAWLNRRVRPASQSSREH